MSQPPVAPVVAPRLTRRGALLSGLPALAAGPVAVGALATGCTLPDEVRPGSSSATTGSPEVSDEELDLRLVEDARSWLASMVLLLERTRTTYVGLAQPTSALLALHRAHDDVLADATGSDPLPQGAGTQVPAGSKAALALVRRRELQLQRQLVDAAGRARSGPLARLLASMSAAVAQQVAILPVAKGAA